jgi:aspartate/methionine/tyrosine aminotransferase
VTPPSFSHRLGWDLPANAWSARLAERRRAGDRLLDLTESNPTRVGIPFPGDEILSALASPGALLYEPVPAGLALAREAVSRDLLRRGLQVDPGRILLTASTSEAYAFLFKLLCDPGDAVLVPQPSYPLFDFLVSLEGVRLVPYPLSWEGGWSVSGEAVREVLAREPRARAVLVVSPNNPTGTYLKRDEVRALDRLAAQRGLALIADEVFSEYPARDVPFPGRVDLLAAEPLESLCFSLGGLSKSAGLPQMKLGWLVAGGPDPIREAAMRRLEFVADAYLSVGAPVQHAAPRLLETACIARQAILDRVRRNLASLAAAIGPDSPVTLCRPEGGWYATLRFPDDVPDDERALALLDGPGVLVHPGYFFDFPRHAWLVVSLLPRPEVFDEGVGYVIRG